MRKSLSILLLVLTLSVIAMGCSPKQTSTSNTTTNTKTQTQQSSTDSTEKKYQYYSADQLRNAIEENQNIIILDVQVKEEWDAHHLKGAIPTYAYPVKTDEEKAKIDAVVSKLSGDQPIIVICPGGAGGATRTIDYLVSTKGIDAERLFILEGGQGKWPYAELLEK